MIEFNSIKNFPKSKYRTTVILLIQNVYKNRKFIKFSLFDPNYGFCTINELDNGEECITKVDSTDKFEILGWQYPSKITDQIVIIE